MTLILENKLSIDLVENFSETKKIHTTYWTWRKEKHVAYKNLQSLNLKKKTKFYSNS